MSRKTARENAYKLIFEYLFSAEKDSFSYEVLLKNPKISKEDIDFTTSLYSGAVARYEDITALIAKNAQGFSLERIYKPDLAALVLAVYEMAYTDTPKTVAITEAIDLVKAYSTEKSGSYVNGILASIYRELIAKEGKND